MNLSKSKKWGQIFTPEAIVKLMVSLIRKVRSCRTLEPCAGKGIFLKILDKLGFKNLTSYEIDDTLENESEIDIQNKDFLETNSNEKFDVIIGNPPYVRWKNIPQSLKDKLKENPYWSGKINGLNDLLYPFIIHSIEKLKNGGELIFITPDFWTSTLHSKIVRKKIIENGILTLMIYFHEVKVFKKVNSNILIFKFIKEFRDEPIKIIEIHSKKKVNDEMLEKIKNYINRLDNEKEIKENQFVAYNHSQFGSDTPWSPLSPSIEPYIQTIENNANAKLGSMVDIGNGMVSGRDKAFKVKNLDDFSEEEKSKFIKVVKAKNLSKYFNIGYTYYIYLNDLTNEQQLESYPKIYDKLKEYKEELKKRYSYAKYIPWWHWVFLRNKALIEKSPKIVVPCKERFDSKGHVRFALVEGDFYVTQDATVLVKHQGVREDTKYILALLNSKVIFDWLKNKSLKRGGVLEFSEEPLSNIPIKRIDWDNTEEVKIHREIVHLVKQVIENKNSKPFYEKIETLVRKLYGLN